MQLSLGGRISLSEGNLLHGVLDDVYVFSPALTEGDVHDIWSSRLMGEAMCAPGFSTLPLSGEEMQQSSLLEGEGLVAGPAAGSLAASGGAPEGFVDGASMSVEDEETEPVAHDDPASEPGAEVEVAPAAPGGFFGQ